MEFRILGPLELAVDNLPVRLSGRKIQRLLAMLLCQPGVVVPTERLIVALRGEGDAEMSRKALQIQVHRLRRILGDDVISYRPPGYVATLASEQLDAQRFESLAAAGRAALAAGNYAQASRVLRQAFALWRGQPLAGMHDVESLREEAERLIELHVAATRDCVEAELRLGRHAELIAELRQLVREHPLREHLRAQLMLALYRCGRQAEAQQVFRDGRRLLLDELGVEPSGELRGLERAILVADPTLDLQDPSAVVVRQGEVAAQLPHDVTDFTGRDEAIDEVGGSVAHATTAVPIVVIAGRGGVGKTTLAVHMAHRLRPSFPDGQLYVDLAGTGDEPLDAGRALGRFLRALGVDSSAVPDLVDERAELYRQRLANRRVLVVLDDAANEAQVKPLLPGSSSCAVIVTSRATLTSLAGARQVTLDEFGAHEALELLSRIAGASRVAAEPTAAAEIVRLCGFLPLAIRIAGARLAARPQLPLSGLVAPLTDAGRRLDVLALGDLGVRPCFALSYRALPAAAKRAFGLLGTLDVPDFAGWVPAALLDLPLPQAESLLDALVDAQLLDVARVDASGHTRYRFHNLVHDFARECAEAAEAAEWRSAAFLRACGAWLALAAQAHRRLPSQTLAPVTGLTPRWPGIKDPHAWVANALDWFDDEHQALIAVTAQACRLGLHQTAWELADSLQCFCELRDLYDEGVHVHHLALRACRQAGDVRGIAVMLRNLAGLWTAKPGSSREQRREYAEQALAILRALGERGAEADALCLCADSERIAGNYPLALAALEEAVAIASAAGHQAGVLHAWLQIAAIHREKGRYEVAAEYAHKCIGLAEQLHSTRDLGVSLMLLGIIRRELEDLAGAETSFRQGIAVCTAADDHAQVAYMTAHLGQLYARQNHPQARATLLHAETLSRHRNLMFGLALSLLGLGEVEFADERYPAAVARLAEAAGLWRRAGYRFVLARTLKRLGSAHAATGCADEAASAWREAMRLYEELDNPTEVGELVQLLESCGAYLSSGEVRATSKM